MKKPRHTVIDLSTRIKQELVYARDKDSAPNNLNNLLIY